MDVDRQYEKEGKAHDCVQSEEQKYKVRLDIIEKRDLFFHFRCGKIRVGHIWSILSRVTADWLDT